MEFRVRSSDQTSHAENSLVWHDLCISYLTPNPMHLNRSTSFSTSKWGTCKVRKLIDWTFHLIQRPASCSGWPPLSEYGRIPGRTLPRNHSTRFGAYLSTVSQYGQKCGRTTSSVNTLCFIYFYYRRRFILINIIISRFSSAANQQNCVSKCFTI